MAHAIRPLFDLTDRVAIVTGSSKGIGEAIARGLAEFGAKVIVSSRKQAAVDEVAAAMRADGLEVSAKECNVGDADQRAALIEFAIQTYGRLDILVNNAGTNPHFGPIQELPLDAYHKTLDTNLTAPLELSRLAYPHLKASGNASIIHISSVEGIHASPGLAGYNLSKAALIMLGKSQSTEWAPDGIRVNVVCPGLIKTKLSQVLWDNEKALKRAERVIPLSRLGTPEEMAGQVVWLAGDAAGYTTGAVIVADGGLLNAALL